jgi:hypothetical protein
MDNQTIRKKLKCAGKGCFVRRILDYVGPKLTVGPGRGIGFRKLDYTPDSVKLPLS